ncbi:unnamed protein product [Lactuca saligna]|uniref:Bet v I/Major latex protein domain-containing protein n=1 Tax=Lactuca saligna TaxID=75948 RepID=A0AA35V6G7_LACSI|nr:unnamed protein product [Lactuca saligna]
MAPSTRSVQIYIKSNGNAFHKLWKSNPQQVPSLTPTNIHKCQINEGDAGNVGCILLWNYFHDGKECVIKTITQDIDEGKNSVTFKGLEGDLMEFYKTFVAHVQVDNHGPDSIVTWTVEYEKLDPNAPDLDTLMEFYKKVTKDIETHHLQN